MLISLATIAAITLGGMSLTYLVAREKSLMWRLAAGNIVGCAVFGLSGFILACVASFSIAVIVSALALTLLPLALFIDPFRRGRLLNEWAKAKGKLQGVGAGRLRAFAYYSFFFLVFWFFFRQAMYTLPDGIYTGGSNNLGDLPFHLGVILGFTDGNNFPPQNPSWAGARFSYPFIADFLTACFVKLGADIKDAIFLQDLSWAMSLLVILERFVRRVIDSKLAGRLAAPLLFFSGGLGFLLFARDVWASDLGLWHVLNNLPQDYTISEHFRWGNSMCVLFITQRSLLLGMPVTLLVIHWLWRQFSGDDAQQAEGSRSRFSSVVPAFLVGVLAGGLPLIHLHSLAVLFVLTAVLFILKPAKWQTWATFGIGVAAVAVPELIWSMSGTANESKQFLGWNFGWDKGDDNIVYFWLKNTGVVIPLILTAIWLRISKGRTDKDATDRYLLFYIPFAIIFIAGNIVKFAPWEWDNIKLLIYWFVGSIPLIAGVIAWAWESGKAWKAIAAGTFAVSIFAGALDVWRTASGQMKIRVFDRDAIQIAEQIKQKTEPRALFLNAPTYNSAVVLSGRPSLMRYSGHLSSHGIDYLPREDDVKRIYLGGGVADVLMRKYNIEYVLISPEESGKLQANAAFFSKYPLIAESGPYRVYKVK